jgi:hypothetical protein
MRTTLKRAGILLLSLFFVATASGAKPKLVSEAEAKKAGLDLINLVFGLKETEAVVALNENKGVVYTDGNWEPSDTAEPVYVYQVAVMDEKEDTFRYAASVNAKTGVAYKAAFNESFLPAMTEEQQTLAATGGSANQWRTYDYSIVSAHCYDVAREWINQSIQPTVPILGFMESGFGSDGHFPEGKYDFYVVMYDATIYYFKIAWPQMQILTFEIRNQIEPNGDDA